MYFLEIQVLMHNNLKFINESWQITISKFLYFTIENQFNIILQQN